MDFGADELFTNIEFSELATVFSIFSILYDATKSENKASKDALLIKHWFFVLYYSMDIRALSKKLT